MKKKRVIEGFAKRLKEVREYLNYSPATFSQMLEQYTATQQGYYEHEETDSRNQVPSVHYLYLLYTRFHISPIYLLIGKGERCIATETFTPPPIITPEDERSIEELKQENDVLKNQLVEKDQQILSLTKSLGVISEGIGALRIIQDELSTRHSSDSIEDKTEEHN